MKENAIQRIEDLKANLEAAKGVLPPEKFEDLKGKVDALGASFGRIIAAAKDNTAEVAKLMKNLSYDDDLIKYEKELEAAKPAKADKPRRGTSVFARSSRTSVVKPEIKHAEIAASGAEPVKEEAQSPVEKKTAEVSAQPKQASDKKKSTKALRAEVAEKMTSIQRTINMIREGKEVYQQWLDNTSSALAGSKYKRDRLEEIIGILDGFKLDTEVQFKAEVKAEVQARAQAMPDSAIKDQLDELMREIDPEYESSELEASEQKATAESDTGEEVYYIEDLPELVIPEDAVSKTQEAAEQALTEPHVEPSSPTQSEAPLTVKVTFDDILGPDREVRIQKTGDLMEALKTPGRYLARILPGQYRSVVGGYRQGEFSGKDTMIKGFREANVFYDHKPFDDLHREIKEITMKAPPRSAADEVILSSKVKQLEQMVSSLQTKLSSLKLDDVNTGRDLRETMLAAMRDVVNLEAVNAEIAKAPLVQEKSAAVSAEEKSPEVPAPAVSEQIVEANIEVPAPVSPKAADAASEIKDTSDMPDVITIQRKSETEKEQAISVLKNLPVQISEGKVAEAITQLEGLRSWVEGQNTVSITQQYDSALKSLQNASKIKNDIERGSALGRAGMAVKGLAAHITALGATESVRAAPPITPPPVPPRSAADIASAAAAAVSTRPPAPAFPPKPVTEAVLGDINGERMIAIMNTVKEIADKHGGNIVKKSGSIKGAEGASYEVKIGDVTIAIKRTALQSNSTLSDVEISFNSPANDQAKKQAEALSQEAMPEILKSMQQIREKEIKVIDDSLRQFSGPTNELIRTNLKGMPDSKIVKMKILARNQLQELAEWKKNVPASDFTAKTSHRYDAIVNTLQKFLANADKQLAPGIEAAKVELEQANLDLHEAKLEFKEAQFEQLEKAFNKVGTAVKFQDNKAQIAQLSAAVKVITATDRYQDCKGQQKDQQYESDMRSVKAPPKTPSNATMKHSADEMKAFDAISKLDKLLDRAKAVKNIPIISNIVQGQIRQQLGKMNDAKVMQGLEELGSKKVESAENRPSAPMRK